MAYTETSGSGGRAIRKEVVDSMIKQIAKPSYKFMQAYAVVSTNAWKNTFFREDTSILAGGQGNSETGLPRGANIPQASPSWEEVSVRINKFALEANIPWEDIISGDINVQSRTIINLTLGVIKAVDDQQWADLTESRAGTGRIQSFALAADFQWDAISAAIIDDLMKAKQVIGQQNYDTSGLVCFISPYDERAVKNYLAEKGAQWMPIATDIAKNGEIGQVAGVKLVTSNSVTASYALVVKPKTCATWKQLVGLQSDVETDPFRSVRLRVVQAGVTELTDPLAVCLISNTQAVG